MAMNVKAAPRGASDSTKRTFHISHRSVSRLMRIFRQRNRMSRQSLDENLPEKLSKLESPRSDDAIAMHDADLKRIAKAYRIPELMLHSLKSTPCDTKVVHEHCDDFIPINKEGKNPRFGVNATYCIPSKVLADTDDVAFVHLHLEPGGHSDVHRHPGDELIYVQSGEIELRLLNTGTYARLTKGDYVHFYAEQEHGVWNPSHESADVMVIRFYQINEGGTRASFLNDLIELQGELAKDHVPRRTLHLLARIISELTLSDDARAGKEIVDRFGLGRFLRLICSSQFQSGDKALTLDDLVKRQGKDTRFNRSRIDRLHNGLIQVSIDQLQFIGELYCIQAFLIANFLYPSYRNAVVVHVDEYQKVPDELVGLSDAQYYVPPRRLTDSDIAVAKVVLGPKACTPANRHPGHELILPVKGEVQVCFEQPLLTPAVTPEGYAHYRSDITHWIANEGERPAEFFAIRFQQ